MRRLLYLAVVLVGLAAPARATSPADLYRYAVGRVAYIETPKGSGSGFLIDQHRRLVVTNYHVAAPDSRPDVYFPGTADGEMVTSRDVYRANKAAAGKLGIHAVGRVVAYDREKDLAIVALPALHPDLAALPLAAADPEPDETLHLIGNPAGRDLWRWCAAVRPAVGAVRGTYPDGHYVNFKAIHCYSSAFGGNSGGPLLNSRGEVLGVCQGASPANGGQSMTAIHYDEVASLLASVRRTRVFAIKNPTRHPIVYQTRWGDGAWETTTLPPNHTCTHSATGPSTAAPSVFFDESFADGMQPQSYGLKTYASHLGRNVEPSVQLDAWVYHFEVAADGKTIRFYSDE